MGEGQQANEGTIHGSRILSLARRRGFLWGSYDIYGGTAGFYDYGPLGSVLKLNIENTWRRYFVHQEGFAEITTPDIGPEAVFRASGHLEEFSDYVVSCNKCGESFRADHLLEGFTINPDTLSSEELDSLIERHGVRCPDCGGEVGKSYPFNLMFRTTIGPGEGRVGYLRPETAQAMFLNFRTLYKYFREKLPFGIVQIGRGYRNEISPRQGLIRLREFNMAELELFIHPENKKWPRFPEIRNETLRLISGESEIEIPVGEAVDRGIIANEALAYFINLTKKFLIHIGTDENKLRFRQHMKGEMAHYASDCWDAEALTSMGWIELVGLADRGCYDLSRHMEHSGEELTVFERYDEPKVIEKIVLKPRFDRLGPLFKDKAKKVADALTTFDDVKIREIKNGAPVVLDVDGEEITVPDDCFEIAEVKETVHGRRLVPHVIEPSFGIDRIIYTVLEHAYTETVRNEEPYTLLRLKPEVAPIKVGVFPLMVKDALDKKSLEIHRMFRRRGIMSYYDDSGAIGRRYARMDEVGTPYCITVDYETLSGPHEGTVTVRDRDTTEQVRVKIDEVVEYIRDKCGIYR